ncbi:Glutaredoxin [Forsythia ovata]|uniref:Glutaredoxin n=1 Tax=Forsythia ovata TaxID=205694 RepID=A0ABD1TP88_9LAMI
MRQSQKIDKSKTGEQTTIYNNDITAFHDTQVDGDSQKLDNATGPASGSFYLGELQFSTTVSNDPYTNEDFRPTRNIESSGLSMKEIVEQDVKENPVTIYMKGVQIFLDVDSLHYTKPNASKLMLASKVLRALNQHSNASFCPRDFPLQSRDTPPRMESPRLFG